MMHQTVEFSFFAVNLLSGHNKGTDRLTVGSCDRSELSAYSSAGLPPPRRSSQAHPRHTQALQPQLPPPLPPTEQPFELDHHRLDGGRFQGSLFALLHLLKCSEEETLLGLMADAEDGFARHGLEQTEFGENWIPPIAEEFAAATRHGFSRHEAARKAEQGSYRNAPARYKTMRRHSGTTLRS